MFQDQKINLNLLLPSQPRHNTCHDLVEALHLLFHPYKASLEGVS